MVSQSDRGNFKKVPYTQTPGVWNRTELMGDLTREITKHLMVGWQFKGNSFFNCCGRLFSSSWAADSEYVVYFLIHWTACRISRLKVKSKAKMALFRTKIFRDEEQQWCWHSFGSSQDADSEYVVHYLIPETSCRISRLKVKSKANMALFETKIVRDKWNHWCWVSFCLSWPTDSEYICTSFQDSLNGVQNFALESEI